VLLVHVRASTVREAPIVPGRGAAPVGEPDGQHVAFVLDAHRQLVREVQGGGGHKLGQILADEPAVPAHRQDGGRDLGAIEADQDVVDPKHGVAAGGQIVGEGGEAGQLAVLSLQSGQSGYDPWVLGGSVPTAQ
jgi:hypothetical protein